MTFNEKRIKTNELLNYIADKIKDIQMRSAEMRNPEDKVMIMPVVKRIRDDLDNITRAYTEIEYIAVEDIEEDEDFYC